MSIIVERRWCLTEDAQHGSQHIEYLEDYEDGMGQVAVLTCGCRRLAWIICDEVIEGACIRDTRTGELHRLTHVQEAEIRDLEAKYGSTRAKHIYEMQGVAAKVNRFLEEAAVESRRRWDVLQLSRNFRTTRSRVADKSRE